MDGGRHATEPMIRSAWVCGVSCRDLVRHSSLNVHPHYHFVVLDGVSSTTNQGEVAFHEADDLTPDRIAHVESVVQHRVLRYFRRQGLLDERDAADMLTWKGSGGFSVDASVRIEAEDRTGYQCQAQTPRRVPRPAPRS